MEEGKKSEVQKGRVEAVKGSFSLLFWGGGEG